MKLSVSCFFRAALERNIFMGVPLSSLSLLILPFAAFRNVSISTSASSNRHNKENDPTHTARQTDRE